MRGIFWPEIGVALTRRNKLYLTLEEQAIPDPEERDLP